MSPSSTITSPELMPTRYSIRSSSAREFDQDSVSGRFDDASLVLGDLRVNQIAAQRPEACQSARLVSLHQTAVSDDIGRQNGREPALDTLCAQDALPGDGRGKLGRWSVSMIALCAPAGGGSSGLDTSIHEGENGKWPS